MLKQAFDKIPKSFLSPVLGYHTSERWNAFVRTFMIRSAATCPVLQSSLTLDGTLACIFRWNQVARKMDLPQQSIPWTKLGISCWMSSILVGFTGTILGYQTFKFWCPCPTQFPHFRNEQLQEIATEQLEHCFRPTEVCWVLPQHLSCEKNNCDHYTAGILAETTPTWKKWWCPVNFLFLRFK